VKGRKPKDPVLSVLDGGRGKRRQPQPVEIPTDYPRKPDQLEGDCAEVWSALSVALQDNGCPVRSSDVFALEDLCRCIARVRSLEQDIGEGVVVKGSKGERKNPKLQTLREYRQAMWRGFERFGLNPVDAQRLPLASRAKTPREKVMEGFDEWNSKQDAGQA
jgi:phage terminase small subunit